MLRLPPQQLYPTVLAIVRTLIDALKREELKGRLWSVETDRVRIYQPPSDAP